MLLCQSRRERCVAGYTLHRSVTLRQLPGDLLVKNLAHGQGDDDAFLFSEEGVDFAGRSSCMTGPSTADTAVALGPGCEAFDFDGDGDVDLVDFGGFQSTIEP